MKYITFLFLSFFILTSCSQDSNSLGDSSGLKLEMVFSENQKFIYSFNIEGEDEFLSKNSNHKSKTNINGQLVILSNEDSSATVETIDLEMEVLDFDGKAYKESFKNKIANSSITGMNTLGEFTARNNDFSTDLYFPLSGKVAKVGDIYDREILVPINVNNSIIYSKGKITLKVVEIKDYDYGLCAKLNGVIDVSLKDIPEDIKGKQEHKLVGNCEYIFNLEKGCFEEIKIPMKLNQTITQVLNSKNNTIKETKISMSSVIKMKLMKIE